MAGLSTCKLRQKAMTHPFHFLSFDNTIFYISPSVQDTAGKKPMDLLLQTVAFYYPVCLLNAIMLCWKRSLGPTELSKHMGIHLERSEHAVRLMQQSKGRAPQELDGYSRHQHSQLDEAVISRVSASVPVTPARVLPIGLQEKLCLGTMCDLHL